MVKAWPLLFLALALGGCLADGKQPNPDANDNASSDEKPSRRDREKCFSTSVAGQPENVCY